MLKRQTGQGLVEFAAVFPLLALMIFVIVDGGFLMGRYNNVNNSAKEGARLGAVSASTSQIVARAKDQAHGLLDSVPATGNCASWGNAAVDDVICVEWVSGPNGEQPGQIGSSVRVRIRYSYDFLTPMTNFFSSGDWDVKVCAIQRMEQSASGIPSAQKIPGVDSC